MKFSFNWHVFPHEQTILRPVNLSMSKHLSLLLTMTTYSAVLSRVNNFSLYQRQWTLPQMYCCLVWHCWCYCLEAFWRGRFQPNVWKQSFPVSRFQLSIKKRLPSGTGLLSYDIQKETLSPVGIFYFKLHLVHFYRKQLGITYIKFIFPLFYCVIKEKIYIGWIRQKLKNLFSINSTQIFTNLSDGGLSLSFP